MTALFRQFSVVVIWTATVLCQCQWPGPE